MRPSAFPKSFDEHAALMYDLAAVAYEANITRVFTYMKSRDASQRVYPNIGVNEPHHAMSHHGNNPDKVAGLVKLNTYHVSLFAKFLEKLQSTPDGDGSLLDHSLILYGSGMSESDTHSRLDVPTLLVGGAAGDLKGQPSHQGEAGNAARQPDGLDREQVRLQHGQVRHQHRTSRHLAFPWNSRRVAQPFRAARSETRRAEARATFTTDQDFDQARGQNDARQTRLAASD